VRTCASSGWEQEVSQVLLRRLEQSVQCEHDFRPDFTHHPIFRLCATCSKAQATAANA
jgi:hypothetical protein